MLSSNPFTLIPEDLLDSHSDLVHRLVSAGSLVPVTLL